MRRQIRSAALAAGLVGAAGACDAILGIPDRTLDPHLLCGTGSCSCAEGFRSCDGDDGNGCEADLQADPLNCGVCGRDCLGGACAAGRCEPVQLVDDPDLGDLAVVGGYVYFTNTYDEPIRRIPVGGGTPEPIPNTGPAALIQVHEGMIYWATLTEVFSTPVDGSAQARLIASDVDPWYYMAVGGGMVYWEDHDINTQIYSMMRAPAQGGPVELLNPPGVENEPWSVTADATHGYWSIPGAIMAIAHDGAVVQRVGDAFGNPLALKQSAGSFYWIANGVYRMPTGGAPVELAAADFDGMIDVDTENVYFTTGLETGDVHKVPILGGETSDLALNQDFDPVWGFDLAVDGEAVYWITENGLFRAAK